MKPLLLLLGHLPVVYELESILMEVRVPTTNARGSLITVMYIMQG